MPKTVLDGGCYWASLELSPDLAWLARVRKRHSFGAQERRAG